MPGGHRISDGLHSGLTIRHGVRHQNRQCTATALKWLNDEAPARSPFRVHIQIEHLPAQLLKMSAMVGM
jgi:hypothetical protein